MPRLYRNAKDLQRWYVFEDLTGWVVFPAKVDGWAERRQAVSVCLRDLSEVPLRLSFNTGLWESARPRRMGRAA